MFQAELKAEFVRRYCPPSKGFYESVVPVKCTSPGWAGESFFFFRSFPDSAV